LEGFSENLIFRIVGDCWREGLYNSEEFVQWRRLLECSKDKLYGELILKSESGEMMIW
jgi:hypothetical protein